MWVAAVVKHASKPFWMGGAVGEADRQALFPVTAGPSRRGWSPSSVGRSAAGAGGSRRQDRAAPPHSGWLLRLRCAPGADAHPHVGAPGAYPRRGARDGANQSALHRGRALGAVREERSTGSSRARTERMRAATPSTTRAFCRSRPCFGRRSNCSWSAIPRCVRRIPMRRSFHPRRKLPEPWPTRPCSARALRLRPGQGRTPAARLAQPQCVGGGREG